MIPVDRRRIERGDSRMKRTELSKRERVDEASTVMVDQIRANLFRWTAAARNARRHARRGHAELSDDYEGEPDRRCYPGSR
jgi:hypothetical protein